MRLHTICGQVDNLSINDEFGFNSTDKRFIERQKELFKDFKFEQKQLKFYSRKTQAYEFIYIDTSCKDGIFTRLSFPLISPDRQRVVIQNTEDCNCMLGGQGGKDLYLKQNGHWKLEKSFDRWISQSTKSGHRGIMAHAGNSGFGASLCVLASLK